MPGTVLVYDSTHSWKPTNTLRGCACVHFDNPTHEMPSAPSLSLAGFLFKDPYYLLISAAETVYEENSKVINYDATLANHVLMLDKMGDREGAFYLGPVKGRCADRGTFMAISFELHTDFLTAHFEAGNLNPIPPRRYPLLARGFSNWGAQAWILLRHPATLTA